MKTKRPSSRSFPASDGALNKRDETLQPDPLYHRTHLKTEEKRISHAFRAGVNPWRCSRQQRSGRERRVSRSGVSEEAR